ncbi:hypothetical protein B0H65DRAFT_480690 [Neurospora tetraspora]|uniref:Uncharacterized protein n=1 Tax=Neurospora tetraspora TaxID=94610 RepID=A0AAE0J2I7_9PEZI|nr:hypothetical protein B0H65DRAFT_480690 [Neurospora tetraspora]
MRQDKHLALHRRWALGRWEKRTMDACLRHTAPDCKCSGSHELKAFHFSLLRLKLLCHVSSQSQTPFSYSFPHSSHSAVSPGRYQPSLPPFLPILPLSFPFQLAFQSFTSPLSLTQFLLAPAPALALALLLPVPAVVPAVHVVTVLLLLLSRARNFRTLATLGTLTGRLRRRLNRPNGLGIAARAVVRGVGGIIAVVGVDDAVVVVVSGGRHCGG